MEYRHYPPPANLRDFIWCFWTLEGKASAHAPFITTPAANSLVNLIFHYKGSVDSISHHGQRISPFVTGIHAHTDRFGQVSIKEDYGIFGVLFYPYALPVLFGMSASDFTNELPTLDSVIGFEANELEEKISASTDTLGRIEIICKFLQRKFTGNRENCFSEVVRYIYRTRGMVDVQQLACRSFLSIRQFERRFKDQCGFSPKKFTRIVRFNSLVSNYKKDNCSLANTAYEFGYYDQSHFIEEFKEFSGTSPARFFETTAFEIFHP